MKTQWWRGAAGKQNCVVSDDSNHALVMLQIDYDARRDMWMWKPLATPVWQDMPGVTNVEEAKAAAFVLWRMS